MSMLHDENGQLGAINNKNKKDTYANNVGEDERLADASGRVVRLPVEVRACALRTPFMGSGRRTTRGGGAAAAAAAMTSA